MPSNTVVSCGNGIFRLGKILIHDTHSYSALPMEQVLWHSSNIGAIHIGGAGPQLTMPLVREHADWWNCPTYAIDRLAELLPLSGSARVSTQHPVALAPTAADRDEIVAVGRRRFGAWGGLVGGTASEVTDALAAEVALGVEGFVVQFTDFGRPETIEHFMDAVAPRL